MSTVLHRAVSPAAIITVIYSRFSSDLQRDASIPDQNRACTAERDSQSWQVGPVFSDRA